MKIKWLDLESSSMKHILCGADYPDLYGLGLYNIKEETAECLFIDERLSSGIFKNPITTLIITAGPNQNDLTIMKSICHHIFIVFIKLTHLIFYESSYQNIVRLLFDFPSPSFFFLQLFCFITLYIHLANIHHPSEEVENQCFFLSRVLPTSYCHVLILPLLYRMSNLEKLGLYLTLYVETFIDGNNLKKNILNHISQLNQFTFDIHSLMLINNTMNLPSKEDIQRTFIVSLY
ncbi:unnamed protein product [Rotaria magnacalcarata]|uniref:Uncharacterized protein n=1 Tax=Rotaria magnacalcarata TaxID=392030 RepID=A0A819I4A3_9BILA|nr:unnamed protein product [Rotaria magnacalcarata]